MVAGGSEIAFRNLYNKWQPVLSTFIFRISKSRDISAEIVQDVFLKIWNNRKGLTEIDNFKSYLFVACKNHALNALRKSMREIQLLVEIETDIENRTFHSNDDDNSSYFILLDESIDKLSKRQKEIYLLHKHERLTYQQIADKLGIGKESVKTHLDLAIKSIYKSLKNRIAIFLILSRFL